MHPHHKRIAKEYDLDKYRVKKLVPLTGHYNVYMGSKLNDRSKVIDGYENLKNYILESFEDSISDMTKTADSYELECVDGEDEYGAMIEVLKITPMQLRNETDIEVIQKIMKQEQDKDVIKFQIKNELFSLEKEIEELEDLVKNKSEQLKKLKESKVDNL